MPYWLASAPSVFQCLINDGLQDYLGRFVIVYIVNILIYAPDFITHVSHVRQVLKKLLGN